MGRSVRSVKMTGEENERGIVLDRLKRWKGEKRRGRKE
jgi:hypothetical protein